MSVAPYPVRWAGRLAVVTVPGQVDVANTAEFERNLRSVLDRKPVTLIVDMTATTFCDSAGVTAIVHAHKQARAAGTELRVAAPAWAVRRVFAVTGLDRLLDTYPSLAASLAGRPPGERPGPVASPVQAGPEDGGSAPGHPGPLPDRS